jgi:hypothetical protein
MGLTDANWSRWNKKDNQQRLPPIKIIKLYFSLYFSSNCFIFQGLLKNRTNYVLEPFERPGGSEVDGSGTGSCAATGFSFIGVETSGCTAKELR